jgi:PadR family transcriptional regulator, regulatory protein AphA
MTIEHAILGLLSWKPLSGYDLKKIIAESDLFYWSGNNNQIYNSLVQMHRAGLVDQQIEYQESLPPRKVYSITDQGQVELHQWITSPPELPERRNSFLIQLAWADLLSDEAIDFMLASYMEEIEIQLKMQAEKARRPASERPNRTPREAYLWAKISANLTAAFQKELAWAQELQNDLRTKNYTETDWKG